MWKFHEKFNKLKGSEINPKMIYSIKTIKIERKNTYVMKVKTGSLKFSTIKNKLIFIK